VAPGGGKKGLQQLLEQQAVDLAVLQEKRRQYGVETDAFLARQRDFEKVLGTITRALTASSLL
jgi:hypothetical protein